MFRTRKPTDHDAADTAHDVDGPVSASDVDVEPVVPAGVFLGSLRSEVDEPDAVAEPFERLAVIAEGVLGAYRRRTLTAEQAAERLRVLRLRTGEGIEWTLGATSMRWYRRLPGGSWRIAAPPSKDDAALTAAADEVVERMAQMAAPSPSAAPCRTTGRDRPGDAPSGHQPGTAAQPVLADDVDGALTDAVTEVAVGFPYADRLRSLDADLTEASPIDTLDAIDATAPAGRANTADAADTEGTGYGDELNDASASPLFGAVIDVTGSEAPSAPTASYGYGDDDEPDDAAAPLRQPARAVTTESAPAAAAALEPVAERAVAEASRPVDRLEDGEPSEQDAAAQELRAMLAELAADTGISLTGFDETR